MHNGRRDGTSEKKSDIHVPKQRRLLNPTHTSGTPEVLSSRASKRSRSQAPGSLNFIGLPQRLPQRLPQTFFHARVAKARLNHWSNNQLLMTQSTRLSGFDRLLIEMPPEISCCDFLWKQPLVGNGFASVSCESRKNGPKNGCYILIR